MDRIPTTNDGALGGNRETAASPLAGALQSRFGERQVLNVPAVARAQYATESGVAPAEE